MHAAIQLAGAPQRPQTVIAATCTPRFDVAQREMRWRGAALLTGASFAADVGDSWMTAVTMPDGRAKVLSGLRAREEYVRWLAEVRAWDLEKEGLDGGLVGEP